MKMSSNHVYSQFTDSKNKREDVMNNNYVCLLYLMGIHRVVHLFLLSLIYHINSTIVHDINKKKLLCLKLLY